MKKAILVTSVIDVDNNHPLTYSKVRSYFSNEERLRQTIYTIASLDKSIDHDTTIFLVDASDNPELYRKMFSFQRNLVYINAKTEFPEIYNLIRTHPHKSHCETLLQIYFFTKFKEYLKTYDYFFKVSGRYFTDSSFDLNLCIDTNTDKFFFKSPMQFEWSDTWNYKMVDRRLAQGNNLLFQYSTVLYGWGIQNYDSMIDIYRVVAEFTDNSKTLHYDIETLIYFFTRDYSNRIIETDWTVYGWAGADGTFLRY
jgi:hypothetical protein